MFNSYLKNTLQYDDAKCIGCEMCWTVCPHGVFAADGRKARITDIAACIECGACQLNCPTRAITVRSGVGCAGAMIQAVLRGQDPDKAVCC